MVSSTIKYIIYRYDYFIVLHTKLLKNESGSYQGMYGPIKIMNVFRTFEHHFQGPLNYMYNR
jgi:hypothetical protein